MGLGLHPGGYILRGYTLGGYILRGYTLGVRVSPYINELWG